MSEIISHNPATLEEIGRIAATPPAKVPERVAAARAACPLWRRLSFRERGKYLLRAREWLLDNADDIAETITIDNGKPLVESLTAEILPVTDLLHHFAHHAEEGLQGFDVPVGILGHLRRRSHISFEPLGVVGIISPWNYPFSIAAGEAAMALVAGNAVLLKPSSATPLVGGVVAELFAAAELPPDIFHHLPGEADTGEALVASAIDKLFFTGSVAVGKRVMADCAKQVTPLVLELGGKDPMIVRPDTDLDVATSGAVWGAFTNAGQCCASVERVYAHASIFDEFVERCVRKALLLKIGNGLDPAVDVGAMTTLAQLKHVEQQVEEAVEGGAFVHCGGKRLDDRRGYFFPPTILTDVDGSFSIVRDETFGPVMPVMPYEDDRQAIHFANDSAYGLTASIWTKDVSRAQEMAHDLQAGTVMINDCVFTHALPATPWGGMKHSGFGRSHSRFGLQEMVHIRHVHTNRLSAKDVWWYPYSLEVFERFAQMARTMSGGLRQQIATLSPFRKLWGRTKL